MITHCVTSQKSEEFTYTGGRKHEIIEIVAPKHVQNLLQKHLSITLEHQLFIIRVSYKCASLCCYNLQQLTTFNARSHSNAQLVSY